MYLFLVKWIIETGMIFALPLLTITLALSHTSNFFEDKNNVKKIFNPSVCVL